MTLGGWAQRKGEVDRRVCVSSRAKFWSNKNSIAATCIHEVAHRLVYDFEIEELEGRFMDGHGPIFFLTLATLYKRVDLELKSESPMSHYLDIYCLQDQPSAFENWQMHDWLPAVMRWALMHSQELAESLHPAEQIPSVAAKLWVEYAQQCNQKKDAFQALQDKTEALELEVKELTQSCTQYAIGGLLSVILVTVIFTCITFFH